MRLKATIGALCIMFLAFSTLQLNAQGWKVYDASVLPAATENAGGDTLDISNRSDDSPGAGMIMEIIDDPDIAGNKIFKYLHPDGKLTFRHYFDDTYTDSAFTIMARIKAENDPAYDRAFDIRWDNGNAGTRDELRIWAADSTIELEKVDLKIKVDMDLYQWHTYRIVVNADYSTVYIDENPVAVVEGATTASSSSTYMKLGDGSGDAIGGYLDWCILNMDGAFAPGEGDLPEGLFVDGAQLPPVQMWQVYDGSVLPEATEGFTGGQLDISNFSDDSPGAGMIAEIIDDSKIAGNKIFKYLHPDGKRTFRHYFADDYSGTAFTIMARIKAENDSTYDRAFDIRWDNGNNGTRDELRIWAADSTIELEKVDLKVKVDMDLYQWHTYRIVVNGDYSKVFVDENPVAVVEGTTTASSSSKYLKVGDGSGDAIGGYLDWLTLDVSGAYEPGEGLPVPEELYVDGTPMPVVPLWQVYDGSILPEATEGFTGNLLDISNRADDSPGAGMIAEIIDDSMISGNKVFKYLHPDGKLTFRHYFPDDYEGTAFTMMARIKAENDPAYDRAFDIRWDNGNFGFRDELRIWPADSTVELEKADLKVKLDMDLYDWHTYRIVVENDYSKLYIDEGLVAVVEGTTTATSSNKYIKIGDGSSDAIGGYLDWFTLDLTGAYDPGEGAPVPEGLYVDGTPLPVEPMWQVYDASVMPEETSGLGEGFLDISNVADDEPGAGLIAEIIDDTDISGNKILKYLHPDGKRTYRHYFADEYEGTKFTIMARIKAENDAAYDRAFDIRWDNSNVGFRDELRIWPADSTLELEKADLKIKLDVDLHDWHTYRIVVDGDHAAVYLDENSEPVVQGTTTASSSNKYIKLGDGSGDAIGGYLDWCILDNTGAYAPGEGLAVPEGLKVDTGPQPVVPKWLVYDANILPTETGSGGDTLDLSDLSQDSPGPGFVEEIIDDSNIEGNKVLKFLMPQGTRMYRYSFSDDYTDSAFTMMTRVKAESEGEFDRAFDIQWRNGNAGSRDQLRISPADSTLELDRSDAEVKVDADLYQWHSYRIAVNGDVTTVYMDQIAEPVLVGTSTESTSDTYIKIGDGSGDAIGGYVDWFILDMSGAYGEGEGLPIPEDLYVDKYVEPVVQQWMVYDANVLPVETEGFGHDSLDISSLSSDSPGPGFVEELIDDPDIEGNKVLKFLMPLGSRMYRYYFPDNFVSGTFTMIARVKQEWDADSTYDRTFDLQWRNGDGGARDELRIDAWDQTLELEKADVTVPVNIDLFKWHTYRMAVNGGETHVYVDENPESALSGIATESTNDRYIKIGDGGSAVNGGYLDWLAIDISGAYSPEEGLPIPDHLFVDDYTVDVASEFSGVPTEYMMSQNYPNPFNPSTTIKFQLPKAGNVKVQVYNTIGQLVTELVNEELDAGYHSVVFDASRIASGVYFYTIKAGDFVDVKKMIMLK